MRPRRYKEKFSRPLSYVGKRTKEDCAIAAKTDSSIGKPK